MMLRRKLWNEFFMMLRTNKRFWLCGVMLALALGAGGSYGAVPAGEGAGGLSVGPAVSLDEVLCRGKGVEIRRKQVDRALMQFKANAMARGQTVPESRLSDVEVMLLDRMVITRLLAGRATAEDKEKARVLADKFISETKQEAGSDGAFERQLLAMSFTEEEFETQILERAICEEVVERELRGKAQVTDEQVRAYYDENAERLHRPEMVRASHILKGTRDPVTGEELGAEQRQAKRREIEKLLERARQGESFGELAEAHSEDPGSREKGGEYTFSRGQMVPEFEAAAFSLEVDKVSDVVTTQFGYHIIKLLQRIPSEKIEFEKVAEDIRESLERREVQEKLLPAFLARLKEEAKLEYFSGAQPPPEADEAG
jgi:parvulin-like peptidyl-prolyl isomerase